MNPFAVELLDSICNANVQLDEVCARVCLCHPLCPPLAVPPLCEFRDFFPTFAPHVSPCAAAIVCGTCKL